MATLAKRTAMGPRGAGWLVVLPLIALFAVAFSALGYVGYVLWPRWPEPAVPRDAPALPVIVAGTLFNIPPAAMRVALQRRPGSHDRLDLAFTWPSLTPPEAATKPGTSPQASERVFLTVTGAGGVLPPAERLKTLYMRYAESQPSPAPDGLAVFPFRDSSPYQNEDLVFDPVAPERFIARCSRPSKGTPGICLSERRVGEAEITARFPRDWLTNWRETAGRLEQLIASLRPTGG